MIRECPVITTTLVHAMVDRARQFNTRDLHDEKLVSLAPSGGAPLRQRAELVWDESAALQAVYPDVAPGTTSLELTAMLPDGGVRPLLWLRDYRGDWTSPYVFVDPVPLPRGAKLVMTTYLANTGDAAITSQPRLHLSRVPNPASTF